MNLRAHKHLNSHSHSQSHFHSHSRSHSHSIHAHTLMKVLNKYQRIYSTEIASFIVCCCCLHINQIESVFLLLLLFMSLLFLFHFVFFLQTSTKHIISIILVFTDIFTHTHEFNPRAFFVMYKRHHLTRISFKHRQLAMDIVSD